MEKKMRSLVKGLPRLRKEAAWRLNDDEQYWHNFTEPYEEFWCAAGESVKHAHPDHNSCVSSRLFKEAVRFFERALGRSAQGPAYKGSYNSYYRRVDGGVYEYLSIEDGEKYVCYTYLSKKNARYLTPISVSAYEDARNSVPYGVW